MIRVYPEFAEFVKSIIICTDHNYNPEIIKKISQEPHRIEMRQLDVLRSCLLDLLKDKKTTHLQCQGYELGENNEIKKVQINLYQTEFMNRKWDAVYQVMG